jgi:hypothetical protein
MSLRIKGGREGVLVMASTTVRLVAKFPWWTSPVLLVLKSAFLVGWKPRDVEGFAARLANLIGKRTRFELVD